MQPTWYIFFFSSRRRHTRFDCDWSSDVCSSDLWRLSVARGERLPAGAAERRHHRSMRRPGSPLRPGIRRPARQSRSEESRVGKESRSWWSADHLKKKKDLRKFYVHFSVIPDYVY